MDFSFVIGGKGPFKLDEEGFLILLYTGISSLKIESLLLVQTIAIEFSFVYTFL